jgi:hypothetical protein
MKILTKNPNLKFNQTRKLTKEDIGTTATQIEANTVLGFLK